MNIGQVINGRYLTFKRTESGLVITANEEGKAEILDHKRDDGNWSRNPDCILADLLEDFMGNGWSWIRPEDIGVLTSANIISDEAAFSDSGNLIECGTVYAFMDYQIKLEIEELSQGNECLYIVAN